MKLHFVGLPHTETTRDYEWCAYTTKLRHMGQISKMIGYDTVLYGSANDEGEFGEVVEVVTEEDRKAWFGHIDWGREVFEGWDPASPWWQSMNTNTIAEMAQRLEPGDAVCVIAGNCQQQVAEAFTSKHVVLEWAVGYEGFLCGTHRCFESHIWRHTAYGKHGINDGPFFDCVIPNSFDLADFTTAETGDYILYLGRMIERKGLPIVAEIAKHHRVLTAGQGDMRVEGAEHLGVVGGEQKAQLLAGAKALVCPTTYIEPFGGAAVEAMLSGTPVISTDFGAFTETVEEGRTGFRCRTLKEFLFAAEHASDLDSQYIRQYAEGRYSLEAVAPQWGRWFRQIETLYGEGWYTQ